MWRNTYGKPFIARRAVCIAQIATTSAIAINQLEIIQSSFTPTAALVVQKALAISELVINTSKAIVDKSHEMNIGFVS